MKNTMRWWVGVMLLAWGGFVNAEAPESDGAIRFDFSGVVQPACFDEALPVAGGGRGLTLRMERATIRAGERWAEVFLDLAPELDLKLLRLQAAVYDMHGTATSVASAAIAPAAARARLLIDMRALNLDAVRLRVELLENDALRDAAETFLRAAAPATPMFAGDQVKIVLSPPPDADAATVFPVTFGVPFAPGALWNADYLRLVDDAGTELPAQHEVTALWAPDGSVKWVRFDALVSVARGCRVEAAAPAGAPPAMPVRVSESDAGVSVAIGSVRYDLAREISPVAGIAVDGRPMADGLKGRGLFVVDQTGRVARMGPADLRVESRGPVAACVRLEGDYLTADGVRLARHVTRLEFFAGQPAAKVTHSLILTEDSNAVWFREIGWEMVLTESGKKQALFGVSRGQPAQSVSVELPAGRAAHIIQERHIGISGVTNQFVARLDDQAAPLAEGAEMGDWAALAGARDGLVLVCKDAAWRHPTEFEASGAGRLVLKLFSNRAGEELDFRAETLVRKWGLEQTMSPEQLAVMRKHTSNAIGWSKTHELWLAPIPGAAAAAAAAAQIGALPGDECYAAADPMWIYHSEAMGPIYPRDRDRFPREEQMIDAYIRQYIERVPGNRYLGFVDYYAGPHYGHAGRYRLPYTLLHDAWIVYARGGDRDVREFAQGANRAYMDNYIAHWGGPGKQRGFFVTAGGGTNPTLKSNFPLYWEESTTLNLATSANLNQFAWDYYITGNRRAHDIILQYADAIKAHWTPESASWRVIQTLRMLLHSYTYTWDPALRTMMEATTVRRIYDPEGAVALSKDRPYKSSTYKMPTDGDILIEAWELLGVRHYHEMAMKISEFNWDLGGIDGRSSGLNANFLYRQTGRADIAAGVEYFRRTANKAYDEEEDTVRGVAYSQLVRTFQGLPYSMDVIVRSDADRRVLASWLDVDDYGAPLEIFVRKTDAQNVNLLLRLPRRPPGQGFRAALAMQPVGAIAGIWWGMDLHQMCDTSAGFTKVRIPKDAPGGTYRITPELSGKYFVLANERVPMVFYAPHYWMPNTLEPPVRIYFQVPAGVTNAAIFFDNTAQVFRPDGVPLQDGATLTGWVDLPADTPGLWSFLPVENGLVRGANFPPFYAMGDPEFHFLPDVDFETPGLPARAEVEADAAARQFVPGVTGNPGDAALYLDAKTIFKLAAGAPHPDGSGGRFIPYREGTIEFFFRPDWGTFDIKNGLQQVKKPLVGIGTDKGGWSLVYRLDPQGSGINRGPTEPSHSLFGMFGTQTPAGTRSPEVRCWLTRTLIEAGQWVHVAWVWGPREIKDSHNKKTQVLFMQVFMNGRCGTHRMNPGHVGNTPTGVPAVLQLPRLRGAVDQLRVSDVQRYTKAFTPTMPDRELAMDAHTRALFLFNDNLDGQSWGLDGAVPAELTDK